MKVRAEVVIETDEFPNQEEVAKERVRMLLVETIQNLSENMIENYDLLETPTFGNLEVVE